MRLESAFQGLGFRFQKGVTLRTEIIPDSSERGLLCLARWAQGGEGLKSFLIHLATPAITREFSRSSVPRNLKLAFLKTSVLSLKPLKYTRVCTFEKRCPRTLLHTKKPSTVRGTTDLNNLLLAEGQGEREK